MRRVGIVAAVSLLVACHSPSTERTSSTRTNGANATSIQHWCVQVDSAGRCALYGPSLITLLARPEAFDGQRIRVIGYVHFQFESNGLYVSQDSYEHAITQNGLWIDPPPGFESDSAPARRQPNDRYVIVEGTLSAQDLGHLGMWSGAIQHVTRLEAWQMEFAAPPARGPGAAP